MSRPGGQPTRQTVEQPRGTFSLLVPALPGGQDVVLFSSPLTPDDPRSLARPAAELARVDITKPPEPDRPDDNGKERQS